jgi:hypothetical protein
LLDAPINAYFASFPAGVGEADNASSGANKDIKYVETELVGQRGRPVGHVHERVDFWVEHFHPDPYVRGILDQGFKVPVDWDKIPESYEEADNKSARKYKDFVQEEAARMVDSGQVVEWDAKPRCCNPLTVAVKRLDDGSLKKRLFLDLSRCVNLAVEDDRYRMTTLQDAINSTRKGDFQVVFYLKSAFHHVMLHADSYELMGFKVVDKGGIAMYYCYVVLVFGFKIAAQVLGRVLKPVKSFLIQNGIPLSLYIDDGLLVGPSKDRVIRRNRFALDVFSKARLLISFNKSSVPEDASTKVVFLGVCIDREMSLVLKNLLCCQKQLLMAFLTTLWWLTDSENVARIFRRGSGDLSLVRLALQVLEIALKLNLDLNPIWVS